MHEVDYIRTLAALLAVLGAIAFCLWLLRRLDLQGLVTRRSGGLPARGGAPTARQFEVAETRWIDQKTRAVVLRWGGSEHLVLLTPAATLLVESRTVLPGPEAVQ